MLRVISSNETLSIKISDEAAGEIFVLKYIPNYPPRRFGQVHSWRGAFCRHAGRDGLKSPYLLRFVLALSRCSKEPRVPFDILASSKKRRRQVGVPWSGHESSAVSSIDGVAELLDR